MPHKAPHCKEPRPTGKDPGEGDTPMGAHGKIALAIGEPKSGAKGKTSNRAHRQTHKRPGEGGGIESVEGVEASLSHWES